MPELPEVESIRSQLERFFVGHIIEKVDVTNRRIFQSDENLITGAVCTGVRRFGKVLSMDMNNGYSLMAHVKMTGQFIYKGPKYENPPVMSKKVFGGVPGPHTHAIFHLDKGGVLYFNDLRRFAWLKIVKTEDVETTGLVGKMGPEPYRDLTLQKFADILSKTKRPVKVVLMDQERMSGVGNIYANDALWEAQIHPTRPANSLSNAEQEKLFNAVLEVLKEGMKFGGSSENAFVTPDGLEGEYQRHTLVYAKNGEVCARCKNSTIEKVMLGGRGTFFCPTCQK